MNNKDLITWKHLQKYLTSQPYFVWNDLDTKNSFDTEELENFWFLDFDREEDEVKNYVEVHKTGFNIIQKNFFKWIIDKYQRENLRVAIISEKQLDLRIKKTMEAFHNDQIDIILYPVFAYNDAISKPTIFDKTKHQISNLNVNTSTKRVDYIRAYFDYEVTLKNTLKVEDYSIFVIEITDFMEGDEITFEETFYANSTSNKPNAANKTIPALKIAALGDEEKLGNTIYEKIVSRELLKIKPNSKQEQITFSGIDFYISRIKDAKDALQHIVNEEDSTVWGTNRFFNEMIKEDYPLALPISGTLLKKKDFLKLSHEKNKLDDFYNEYKITKYIKKNIDEYDIPSILAMINPLNGEKVVWYDFEGFSLPFAIISHTLPYQQLIFQVSVIKTKNDVITNVNNLVIDPKVINYKDFFNIIDAIYVEDANAYVVYNKSYENTKLNEMLAIFDKEELKQHNKEFSKKIKIYHAKVEAIIASTIDLLDLFKVSSPKNPLPPIFLWELYGFSSIKKIEKYITKHKFNLEVMIKPYSDLAVQNGLMAMSKAIDRRLDGIGDHEWDKTIKELKKYCENDVRAMLMVYYFAKNLVIKN